MRYKLALTIALASLALSALCIGVAGADPLGELGVVQPPAEPVVPSPPPPPSPPASPSPPAACANGLDDDGDGLADLEDPECSSAADSEEGPPTAAEASPTATEAGQADSAQVQQNTPLNGDETGAGEQGGVVRNQSLGPGGAAANGGIGVPPATAGVQPPAKGPNGGLSFNAGGSPTAATPGATIAIFGPAPIGVPNFIIDSFEIPPFLLPIYQACGTQYGIPWQVLASINKIETGFGTNLNVSSAGAVGWMQFLPSTWKSYGVDANGDGRKDPYNPVDAICGAAHYLRASGGAGDLYKAIFSYNPADWYVQEVLLYAKAYGKLPPDLVGSLTGLTEGAHFPVAADARYADDISTREALKQATPEQRNAYGNAAEVVSSSPTRRGINIYSHPGAPVVAVNDGVIKAVGDSPKLGRYIVLEDAYGNRYIYAELGQILHAGGGVLAPHGAHQPLVDTENLRPRLYALPQRQAKRDSGTPNRQQPSSRTLKVGSRVVGGAVIARVGAASEGVEAHINFSIRPAGSGAAKIDPKPILDGWKLLEATAIYRANGKNPFADSLSVSGVLLLPKDALEQRVLHDHSLSIYQCGREDVAAGRIDRRVLAVLEYLVSKGFRLTVTSLECGHGELTSSGNVSEHSSGNAVDIAAIDDVPVADHQGPGTLTDALIKTVLRLQGTMHPHQVISLEDLPGETSFAMADHADHVHIGYYPGFEIEYVSPFLTATTGRIDQGVDFTGIGPIAAVGDAEILAVGAPGWPEGGGVLYKLLTGSRAGQIIFVYEGVDATVKAGQHVAAGEQIATFRPGGSIEMGFADAAGVPLSHAEYTEGTETIWGREMASFLTSIGGASGLSPSLGELSADKWNRLTERLAEIDNPQVPTGPSKYALPDGPRP